MSLGLSARDRAVRRRPVPLPVKGRFRRIKTAVGALLLGLFFLVPWLRFDRGPGEPGQAVIFDVPGRRFLAFGLEFWPQDLPIVLGLMVLGALGLFLATVISGRLWCGFTCPQTVWTDLFFTLDRIADRIAGKGSARARALRQIFWLALSLATGFGFAAYFTDVAALPGRLLAGTASTGIMVTVLVLAATTWLLAGYARERVCLHMCPWPRFQAALLDADSLVVSYQAWRGEPRGKKRLPLKAELAPAPPADGSAGRGDCIDCDRCFAVCPTGVDIRQGLQMGCIGCGLCIDACDDVMTRLDRPAGLIRFDSEAHQASPSLAPPKARVVRPKTLLIAAACAIALGFIALGLLGIDKVTIDVDPQRNPPYVALSDGSIRNDYIIRLSHRLPSLAAVTVTVEGLPGAEIRIGDAEDGRLAVRADRTAEDRLLIAVPKAARPKGRTAIAITFADAASGAPLGRIDTYFWGPP